MTDKVKVDKGVLVGHETALEMQKIVEYFRINGLLGSEGRRTADLINGPAIYVRNDDTDAAPPYACMQVTGTAEVGGQNYLTVEQPSDASGAAGWYLFNGPSEIEPDGFGIAFDGPLCRMLTDGSTVTAGETWGPVSGQWEIEPSGSMFIAAGEDDIATDIMRGFFIGPTGLILKTPGGGIAARSGTTIANATCTIWKRAGTTLSATSITLDVYNMSTTAIPGTTYITAFMTNIGWQAIWEDC